MRLSRYLPQLPAMSSHERSVLAATCLSSLGSFYTMVVTACALPQIQRGLAISEDDVASLFALLRIGSLFSIVLAVLADRMGRRRLLIASVAGCALCNIATAFAQSGLQLAWLQLGSRLFLGSQILLAGVVVSEELSAENRGWGLGVLTAVGGLGGGADAARLCLRRSAALRLAISLHHWGVRIVLRPVVDEKLDGDEALRRSAGAGRVRREG